MAEYRDARYLVVVQQDCFQDLHEPRTVATHTGIYRCEGCGLEIALAAGSLFPRENAHYHSNPTIPILWRLVVRAKTDDLKR